jgi:hypothetical protein
LIAQAKGDIHRISAFIGIQTVYTAPTGSGWYAETAD